MADPPKEKTTVNLTVVPAVLDAFYLAARDVGLNEKEKWLAVAAAMLLFVELPQPERAELLGTVTAAKYKQTTWEQLVADARRGKRRKK